MLWNLHISEKTLSFLRKQESRGMQPDRNLDPRFREDDIYARILILLKIYVELRLKKISETMASTLKTHAKSLMDLALPLMIYVLTIARHVPSPSDFLIIVWWSLPTQN